MEREPGKISQSQATGHMVSPRLQKGQGLMPELTSEDHASKLCVVGCTAALMET